VAAFIIPVAETEEEDILRVYAYLYRLVKNQLLVKNMPVNLTADMRVRFYFEV
jgi:hypothetical protein